MGTGPATTDQHLHEPGLPPAATDADAVRVRDVSRRYRARRGHSIEALRGVSLEIPRGRWVALLGPNGSGKSTLLRLVATLEAPGAGEVEVLGEDAASHGAGRRRVRSRLGVVFQRPALDPLLSVRENMRTQAALFGLRGEAARCAVEVAIQRLGLADRADQRVRTLSGGLARRADLARALVHEPELLLLDEPTSGLDLAARRSFLELLESLHRERGLTIVLATHLMDEAERSQRVVMLHEGRVVADGTPVELREQVGPAVLRVQETDAARRTLDERGLEIATARSGELVVRGASREQMARAAESLIRDGIAFAVAPPTLADAYLMRTGATLDDTQDDQRESTGGAAGGEEATP